jgi:membrane protease YdiL (CAAX protease family)
VINYISQAVRFLIKLFLFLFLKGAKKMKLRTVDLRLSLAIIFSHLLLFFSFQDKSIFWYIYTASLLLLITFAILHVEVDDQKGLFSYLSMGVLSGLLLYGLFWVGYHGVGFLQLGFQRDIHNLYRWYGPSLIWEYFALILVAGPGEEIFWRGFVQKRLLRFVNPKVGIIFGAILYASVHVYSGKFMLILAAFLAGIVWGTLYYWKKSRPLVIVSHIVFDIMLFIILPLQ